MDFVIDSRFIFSYNAIKAAVNHEIHLFTAG